MSPPICPHASLVEALHDGRLGPAEEASTRRHLATCSSCATQLADMDRLRESLGDTPPVDPMHHRRARLALLRAASSDAPPRPRRLALVLAMGALAVGPAVWAATAHFRAPVAVISPQETVVRPAPAAVFQRAKGPRSDVVTLTNGALDVEVPPLSAAEPFILQTQDARLETEGATLRLEAHDGKLLQIAVSLGQIRLTRAGTSVLLAAGGAWSAEPPAASSPPLPSALPALAPSGLDSGSPSPRPLAPPTACAARSASNPPAVNPPAVNPPAVNPPAVNPPEDSSSRDFSEGMEALARGDAAQAAARFDRFRQQHPADARADDAAYLRAIALQRAGRRTEAAAVAREYLATHPRGAHREQAKKIAGERVE
jgi:TolA-binding protein